MDKQLKQANEEGMRAYHDGLDICDCPYDSFDQETEARAFEWLMGYRDAEFYDHDHAPR